MLFIISLIFCFCIGAVFASFINLIVYRLEDGHSILDIFFGRSFCESCKKDLSWFELIPIFSYVFLRGRCYSCKKPFSSFNFFSEIILAVSFSMLCFFSVPIFFYLFLLILYFWAVYDFFYKSIPKKITDVVLFLSFVVWLGMIIYDFNILRVYPVLVSICLGLVIYLISFRKQVFGFGDVVVAVILSFWLNLGLFLATLLSSVIIGGIVSLGLVIKDRSYLKQYVPFLPFVYFGFLVVLLLDYIDYWFWFDYIYTLW